MRKLDAKDFSQQYAATSALNFKDESMAHRISMLSLLMSIIAVASTGCVGLKASTLGIMSIPTLMIFRDRVQLFAQPGALPKGALDDLLRQVRELDMDEVRAQLADGADSPS